MSTSLDVSSLTGVSRVALLQTLLSRHGAPGSLFCNGPNDLVAVSATVCKDGDETFDLHPQLIPLAKSESTGKYVCALRIIASGEEGESEVEDAPFPLVEAGVCGPGMNLLALNSEHLMRRIAAEADFGGKGEEIVELYNVGISDGDVEKGLDSPYEPGSVEKLGYGIDKYTLLRVGPFPDLYKTMSDNHAAKNDESSSLIAAETANRKFPGFASTFLSYARRLSMSPNREDETKDAARVCLRLKLHSIGSEVEDFADVAVLVGVAEKDESIEEKMGKLAVAYEKIRKHELEQEDTTGKTPLQSAMEDAKYLMDKTALTGGKWGEIRGTLADIYAQVGKNEAANFVDPSRVSI